MEAVDRRLAELKLWLDSIGCSAKSEIQPASDDASFRRYFRISTAGSSLIAVDAPPQKENSRPFVRIAGYLAAMGVNVPRVIEFDAERGFLLLSDLGRDQYLEETRRRPQSIPRLYDDAIAALLVVQTQGHRYQSLLPPFDAELLQSEMSLFSEWLCERLLGLRFSAADIRAWGDVCELLINNALLQPQVFVHADYHSRNLIVSSDRNPGILDFQDAMEGPVTYDLVSLLKDCYLRLPAEEVRERALRFHAMLSDGIRQRFDEEQFLRSFELMGVQRHLKASGIFARLNMRDGKPRYMQDVPRTLSYIMELAPRYAELEFLFNLLDSRLLPALMALSG
jgi:aminoglycoside/choline kinase family phosphotransferase